MPNTPASDSNPKTYPLKPEKPEGFKKAVAWFGGREFVASLKSILMYAIYGENMDPRSWMKPNIYPNVEEKVKSQKEDKYKKQAEKNLAQSADAMESLDSVVNVQASENLKNSEEVKAAIEKKLTEEWARKILDYWKWKRMHFEFWEKYLAWLESAAAPEEHKKLLPRDKIVSGKATGEKELNELWFDFIADSGDGQMGVYNVACMCFADLWTRKVKPSKKEENTEKSESIEKPVIENADVTFEPPPEADWENYELLPRGYFLFVGGDTAYHSANYETIFERFQKPFRWGFTSVRKMLFETYKPAYLIAPPKPDAQPGDPENSPADAAQSEEQNKVYWDQAKFLPIKEKPKKTEDFAAILDADLKPVAQWDGTIYRQTNNNDYWDTEPPRPFFGIPANHDYYDSIDGFNRQFRRAPFNDIEENMINDRNNGRLFLQIPTFSREQEASYIAVRLPFDWWFFGIDSENEKLDFRQEYFFKQIMEKKPKKLILATPEPTTVFGKECSPKDKTAIYLETITASLELEQPFLKNGKLLKKEAAADKNLDGYCRLDLSGDVHHYARYWGPDGRDYGNKRFSSDHYASLVAGGGGAFFDVTSTLIGDAKNENDVPLKDKDGKKIAGEIPPKQVFPSEELSISRTAAKIFDLGNIKEGGYIQFGGFIFAVAIFFFSTQFSFYSESPALFENPRQDMGFIVLVLLLLALGGTAWAARNLNDLIKKIKIKILELKIPEAGMQPEKNTTQEEELMNLVRIRRLILNSLPFIVSVVLYGLFIIPTSFIYFKDLKISPFANSLFLLIHVAASALLIWLSFEYTNWLAIRFKLSRRFRQKTFTDKLEDPNEDAKRFIKETFGDPQNFILKNILSVVAFLLGILGYFSRRYSYKYFPAVFVVILAVIALIFGIGRFGGTGLAKTFADLLLITLVGGGFVLLAYILAFGTGAAYLKWQGKTIFLTIGLWHAALQLFTPFVLFYYANWRVVILVLVLTVLINGISNADSLANKIFPVVQNITGKSFIRKVFEFRFAAWLMNFRNPLLMMIVWVGIGAVILYLPFVLFNEQPSLSTTISYRSLHLAEYYTDLAAWLKTFVQSMPAGGKILESMPEVSQQGLKYFFYILLSIVIIGIIGYRMSCVWFGWYLGVSVLFNGHNNEAGGLARIEGFKHILRIKVEETKLTVYVIGMENACPDIKDLKLKLVDKFELNCSNFSKKA